MLTWSIEIKIGCLTLNNFWEVQEMCYDSWKNVGEKLHEAERKSTNRSGSQSLMRRRGIRINIIHHSLIDKKGYIMKKQTFKLSVYNVLRHLSNEKLSLFAWFFSLFLVRVENIIPLPWKIYVKIQIRFYHAFSSNQSEYFEHPREWGLWSEIWII